MKWLIGLLTAATGILHILVGFNIVGGFGVTNWMLVLNGVGYLVLLVLFWTSSAPRGGTIRWILLAYTLITLIGYFVIGGSGSFENTIGLVIKAIELLLVILLLLYRGHETAPAPAPAASRAGTTGTMPSGGMGTSAGTIGTTTRAAGDISVATTVGAATAATVGAAAYAASEADAAVDTAAVEAETTYDTVAETVDEGVESVADGLDELGERAGDAVDAVGDMASDAADAVGDAVGGAVDATGAALAGAAAAVGAVAASAADEVQELVDGDSEAPAAEPTAEELRAELESYLRSIGGSEFRKEIEYVEGIGPAYGAKLRGAGVVTVLDLMVEGATRLGRKHLSDRSGISQSQILTWVNHIDLYRLKGVAQEYADLLEQSGVDTVVELAQRNPKNLFKRMNEVNEQKNLVRRTPHLSEVESWVEQAKNLKRLIHY